MINTVDQSTITSNLRLPNDESSVCFPLSAPLDAVACCILYKNNNLFLKDQNQEFTHNEQFIFYLVYRKCFVNIFVGFYFSSTI